MPDRAVFSQSWWQAYQIVNNTFAQKVIEALKQKLDENPDSIPTVWIHDYHLMLAANKIRQLASDQNLHCKIGFFLHVHFPSWDIMKIFPWLDLILQGILGKFLSKLIYQFYHALSFILKGLIWLDFKLKIIA